MSHFKLHVMELDQVRLQIDTTTRDPSMFNTVLLTKKKPIVYTAIILWLLSVQYFVYVHFYKKDNTQIYGSYHGDDTSLTPDNLRKDKTIDYLFKVANIPDDRGRFDQYSTNYHEFFKHNSINTILAKLGFSDRCDLYFKSLFRYDINWILDPNADLPSESKGAFSFNDFKQHKTGDLKKEYLKIHDIEDLPELDTGFNSFLERKYEEFHAKVQKVEQKSANYLSILRIFNKCYVTGDDVIPKQKVDLAIKKQQNLVGAEIKFNNDPKDKAPLYNPHIDMSCDVLEKRVYPWLSHSYPVYERHNGATHFKPPQMKKFLDPKLYPEVFSPTNQAAQKSKGNAKVPKHTLVDPKSCFLNNFKNSLSGKGIVLSIGDHHVDATVSLIRLLRALNNKFPIQIVYFDGLSKDSREKLVSAARDVMLDLPDSFHKVKNFFPPNYLDSTSGDFTIGLPQQELWFVNVYHAIRESYRSKFSKFGNKFFATLFNSFEEYILLDADSVLTQPPEFFFNLAGYKKTGAYFYRDRTATQHRSISDGKFFTKVSPSIVDKVVFEIDIISNKTLNTNYFHGLDHLMESGLVVIDRNIHFNSILMVLQLNMMSPARDRSYGDKELFWLGFSVNGDESYEFNANYAASIGEKTPQKYLLNNSGKVRKSEEICSNHPGHIDNDNKTLAWFNSGFLFCGQNHRVNFEEEAEKGGRFKWLKQSSEFMNLYGNPMRIKHAIIPPFIDPAHMRVYNDEDEPDAAWYNDSGYCRGYLWCAYSRIGGTQNGVDNSVNGTVVKFDTDTQNLLAYYGDVWAGVE